MYSAKFPKDIRCPLEYGLEIFGGRWKSRILCLLAEKERLRYSEIKAELENASDTAIASCLKELRAEGLLIRTQYIPPHVEYSLTDKALELVPLLRGICRWAGKHLGADSPLELRHCKRCMVPVEAAREAQMKNEAEAGVGAGVGVESDVNEADGSGEAPAAGAQEPRVEESVEKHQ